MVLLISWSCRLSPPSPPPRLLTLFLHQVPLRPGRRRAHLSLDWPSHLIFCTFACLPYNSASKISASALTCSALSSASVPRASLCRSPTRDTRVRDTHERDTRKRTGTSAVSVQSRPVNTYTHPHPVPSSHDAHPTDQPSKHSLPSTSLYPLRHERLPALPHMSNTTLSQDNTNLDLLHVHHHMFGRHPTRLLHHRLHRRPHRPGSAS